MFKKYAQCALLCIGLMAASLSFGFNAYTDIHGLMQNNVYSNSILDFSIKFPEDWTGITQNHQGTTALQTRQIAADGYSNLDTVLDSIKDNKYLLFSVSADLHTPDNTGIIGSAIKLSGVQQSDIKANEQLLEQIRFAAAKTHSVKPDFISPITYTKLGGLEFASMNIRFKLNGNVINQNVYAAVRKDYILFFVTTFNNDKEAVDIQKTFDTMLFY